jgi:hypothetical protein
MREPPGAHSSHCRYHCRSCGGHFTSLRAFDAHREGSAGSNRDCTFPEDAPLVERTGVCKIAGELPLAGVTVYELAGAQTLRDYWNARESVSMHGKQAA